MATNKLTEEEYKQIQLLLRQQYKKGSGTEQRAMWLAIANKLAWWSGEIVERENTVPEKQTHDRPLATLAAILNKHRSRIYEQNNHVLDDIWDQFFSEMLKWLENTEGPFDRVRFIDDVVEEK